MPQSQYYKQEWDNHHHSSQSQWAYNSPESYYQQPYQQRASYNPYQHQPIEEKSSLEKNFEDFLESTRQVQIIVDSILLNNSQIQDPHSNFQVQPEQEEPADLEKNMEFMIQSQNDYIQSQTDCLKSLNRLEVKVSHLVKHN